MPRITAHPRIRLSQLRDIGRALWNPVQILGPGWRRVGHRATRPAY
ncbi:MAG: hypothetical protein ACK5LJ_14845 [Paracoccus sp. (in: a-proteobacteria)]